MDKVSLEAVMQVMSDLSELIIKNEVYFCELDSVAGDGDFGMSLSKGFKAIQSEWASLSRDSIGSFLKDCGSIITEHCGGATGPLWGGAFKAGGKYTQGKHTLDLSELSQLFQAFVDAIQKRGGAELGDKTLLDALIPATNTLIECAENNEAMMPALNKSALSAHQGAEKTKEYSAKKGRATYVGDRSLTHPDAGAMAIAFMFKTLLNSKL